ncbi:hypothetical protein PInf_012988 [Phytophthora infestans]|nr:hypothetical protein PInf_012988 [Phytophthora infestans]
MLSLATNAVTERLKIGGIAVRRSLSPKLLLKVETNLNTDGSCLALDAKHEEETSELWNDQVIASVKIPKEERREGGGQEAPNRNARNEEHVNKFLAEVKTSATLDHPHIVGFVGVSWTSVSDVYVIQEFAEGGDLRSLLDKYEAEKHVVGFDQEKTKIAMQICSALAHMHSQSPPVIHGNLKSRNVLLNSELEAKVTNFGTESKKKTLWMAPEILRGGKQSTDADMFSFGVLLSELDMLSAPYSQARKQIHDSSWCILQDAAILEKVTKGSLRVVFSESGPMALAELGRACVSINPLNRPTASEALYRLQMILSEELA